MWNTFISSSSSDLFYGEIIHRGVLLPGNWIREVFHMECDFAFSDRLLADMLHHSDFCSSFPTQSFDRSFAMIRHTQKNVQNFNND